MLLKENISTSRINDPYEWQRTLAFLANEVSYLSDSMKRAVSDFAKLLEKFEEAQLRALSGNDPKFNKIISRILEDVVFGKEIAPLTRDEIRDYASVLPLPVIYTRGDRNERGILFQPTEAELSLVQSAIMDDVISMVKQILSFNAVVDVKFRAVQFGKLTFMAGDTGFIRLLNFMQDTSTMYKYVRKELSWTLDMLREVEYVMSVEMSYNGRIVVDFTTKKGYYATLEAEVDFNNYPRARSAVIRGKTPPVEVETTIDIPELTRLQDKIDNIRKVAGSLYGKALLEMKSVNEIASKAGLSMRMYRYKESESTIERTASIIGELGMIAVESKHKSSNVTLTLAVPQHVVDAVSDVINIPETIITNRDKLGNSIVEFTTYSKSDNPVITGVSKAIQVYKLIEQLSKHRAVNKGLTKEEAVAVYMLKMVENKKAVPAPVLAISNKKVVKRIANYLANTRPIEYTRIKNELGKYNKNFVTGSYIVLPFFYELGVVDVNREGMVTVFGKPVVEIVEKLIGEELGDKNRKTLNSELISLLANSMITLNRHDLLKKLMRNPNVLDAILKSDVIIMEFLELNMLTRKWGSKPVLLHLSSEARRKVYKYFAVEIIDLVREKKASLPKEDVVEIINLLGRYDPRQSTWALLSVAPSSLRIPNSATVERCDKSCLEIKVDEYRVVVHKVEGLKPTSKKVFIVMSENEGQAIMLEGTSVAEAVRKYRESFYSVMREMDKIASTGLAVVSYTKIGNYPIMTAIDPRTDEVLAYAQPGVYKLFKKRVKGRRLAVEA